MNTVINGGGPLLEGLIRSSSARDNHGMRTAAAVTVPPEIAAIEDIIVNTDGSPESTSPQHRRNNSEAMILPRQSSNQLSPPKFVPNGGGGINYHANIRIGEAPDSVVEMEPMGGPPDLLDELDLILESEVEMQPMGGTSSPTSSSKSRSGSRNDFC